jgi:hypothetical protein
MIGAMVWHFIAGKPPVVARFAGLDACRWMDPGLDPAAGDVIREGERIGLSAGRAELRYETGARVTVHGPAIFEARSRNGGFLILGEADLVADHAEISFQPLMQVIEQRLERAKIEDRGAIPVFREQPGNRRQNGSLGFTARSGRYHKCVLTR